MRRFKDSEIHRRSPTFGAHLQYVISTTYAITLQVRLSYHKKRVDYWIIRLDIRTKYLVETKLFQEPIRLDP
jgi:hypothetical protein